MTIVFHTNPGVPVLAGDMLLSRRGPHGRTALRLPSQPRGVIVPRGTIPRAIPVTLRRKIFVVNDRLAVGASGTVDDIGMFVNNLTQRFGERRSVTYDEVSRYLEQYASTQPGRGVSSIVLVEAEDRRASLASGLKHHHSILSQRFGRVIAIGAGADTVIEQIERLETIYKHNLSQPPDGKNRFPEFGPLTWNLMVLANLYWAEFASPSNLFRGWGGAYDLIYQDSHKIFRHIEDYTLILRQYDVDAAGKGIQPTNVLKYERRPQFSFITMLGDGKLEVFAATDITAAPGTPIRIELNRNNFTMNSKIHVSIVAIRKGNKVASPLIVISGVDGSEDARHLAFTWFDDTGRLAVAFHKEFDDWLQEQVVDYCASIRGW